MDDEEKLLDDTEKFKLLGKLLVSVILWCTSAVIFVTFCEWLLLYWLVCG